MQNVTFNRRQRCGQAHHATHWFCLAVASVTLILIGQWGQKRKLRVARRIIFIDCNGLDSVDRPTHIDIILADHLNPIFSVAWRKKFFTTARIHFNDRFVVLKGFGTIRSHDAKFSDVWHCLEPFCKCLRNVS